MTPFETPQIQVISYSVQSLTGSNEFPVDPVGFVDADSIGIVDLS